MKDTLRNLIPFLPKREKNEGKQLVGDVGNEVSDIIELNERDIPKTIVVGNLGKKPITSKKLPNPVVNKRVNILEERRAHHRVESKNILDMQIDVFLRSNESGKRTRCVLANISLGGIRILSKQMKEIGEIFKLNFKLGVESFELKGRIVNEFINSDGNYYGIQFLNLSSEDQLRIDQIIASIKLIRQR
ncbi:MAG: PilZ domain-containing protein [Candidatus Gracilibacteria bacterium]|nr:PilZ domain-containing protein [Candidatus Gracilibacteria bacterium]